MLINFMVREKRYRKIFKSYNVSIFMRRWLSTSHADETKHVKGYARFVDDIKFPNMLYVGFIRSPHPHALIKKIDYNNNTLVLTAEDLERYVKPLELNYSLARSRKIALKYLAHQKVRYVGEPVAAVIASDNYSVVDECEKVSVDYEILSAVPDVDRALSGESLLYEEWGTNILADIHFKHGSVEKAFQESPLVVDERIETHRQSASPMETRGCIAYYDRGDDVLNVWVSNQNPHVHRALLSNILGLPESRVRVVVPDVGGGFGQKGHLYPENVVVAVASMITGRPVKWIETRRENLISAAHSRQQVHYVKIAAKKDGVLTALQVKTSLDVGAGILYPHDSVELAHVVMDMLPAPYRLKNYEVRAYCVVTNKTPAGAYRGFGHPEATFVRERILDIVAEKLGLEPEEIRLRNLVTTSDLPYVTPTGMHIDSGDPKQTFLKLVEYTKKMSNSEQKRYVGVGYAVGVKGSAPSLMSVTHEWGSSESASVKIFPDGKIVVYSGVVSMGTRIRSALAKLAAGELGVEVGDVEVVLGDTNSTPFSTGLWGSRGIVMAGGAVIMAAKKLRKKLEKVAAHILECREEDIVVDSGRFYVKDDPEKYVTIASIASTVYNKPYLFPPEIDLSLEEFAVYDVPNISRKPDSEGRINAVAAVSTAAASAVVELDVETGFVRVLEVIFVENGGNYINPRDVDDQLLGGIMQGLAGALYENIKYSEDGTPLTTTFADYLLPTSAEAPEIKIVKIPSPSPYTPLGVKGVGETGVIPIMAAVANAVSNALKKIGKGKPILHSNIEPEMIWMAIRNGS
jgi:carbon-monoxide dehydrogenase large subunit